ncbi:MAG: acyl-ACP--UDP-N-acetylglucosamine O-acyltransferase [Spirochaetia bacterium]|nr:acyl-ACP--UDP-N-acetylglucosamine O-acyltransferase [Spirochaetia bacterium]
MSKIHSTAIVDKKAEIADDVEIGPFSIIGPEVKIGKGCKIASHVEIKSNVEIQENNEFYHGCLIGEKPQDLTIKNSKPKIIIGSNNVFREFSTVHQPSVEGGATEIGNNNFIMGTAHIAHDVKIGNKVILVQGCALGGYVQIEDNVYIGGLSGIHQFCRVGTFAIVGGVSKVVKDVPPYIMADGQPGKAIGINKIGMKRAGIPSSESTLIRKAFKILYRSNISTSTALEKIKSDILLKLEKDSSAYKKIYHFIDFIEAGQRGIIDPRL